MVLSDKWKENRKELDTNRKELDTNGIGPFTKDLTQEELISEMKRLTELGWVVFVKWTCECGERVTCDLPNTIFTKGYEHTEKSDGTNCGCVSYPERFGILILGMIDPSKLK